MKTEDFVEKLANELNKRGMMLATAESCTGGLVAAAITDRPGASFVFERGFIAYSNESKHNLLGVTHEILDKNGAVSRECAAAMVQGTLTHSLADMALSVTGIAGPAGGTPEKPVGLVYIGWGLRGGPVEVAAHHFTGDRNGVREQTVNAALTHLTDCLKAQP